MPSRVIREGLLDSQRYWSVTVEARQLFVHLMLLADDFGLVSLAPVFIRRRCFDDAPSPAKIDRLLEQLQDAELLRMYEIEGGRYGFIPRFGQRLRMMRCKHPAPPVGLLEGDQEAQEKFRANRHLFEKLSAGRRQLADKSRPEVESESETKRNESKAGNGKGAQQRGIDLPTWAAAAGLARGAGESEEQFTRRAGDAWMKSQAGERA